VPQRRPCPPKHVEHDNRSGGTAMPWNKRWLLLLMTAFALTAGAARGAGSLSAPKVLLRAAGQVRATAEQRAVNPRLIRRYRAETWRWQALMGAPRTRRPVRPSTRRVLRYWVLAAGRAYAKAIRPPHKRAWRCLHRYEGSWRDSGDPYWGGLQMDHGFMAGYAPHYLLRRGWADRWTPLEQMWVAERAFRSGRGFWAWPNSARMCGLI
jgi:hypothetical protein